MIEHIVQPPLPGSSEVRVHRIEQAENDPEREKEEGRHGRPPGQDRKKPAESSRVDVVSISDAARGRLESGESKSRPANGDYARGVFDRARKSGLHVRPPPRKRDTPESVEAMRRALRSVTPETREMLKIVADND